MHLRYSVIAPIIVLMCLCQLPQNLRTPENAGVDHETLSSLPVKAAANAVFACTVSVLYPEFIDSFALYQSTDGAQSVKIDGGVLGDDTVIVLSIVLPHPASYDFSFFLYKTDGVDTVTASLSVFSTTPEVQTESARRTVPVGDSVVYTFVVTDADSNMLEYMFSGGIFTAETHPFLASERAAATVTLTLSEEQVRSLRDTLMFFAMTAVDESGQTSRAAVCTLLVSDSVPPMVAAVAPLGDSAYMVDNLPDTLRMTIRDAWRVDSVKYGGTRVLFTADDTVMIPVANIDSGTTIDSLEAWDPAGNRTVKVITLQYAGAKVYPPKITPFFQTVNERQQFDTVFLDTKVTITDTTAAYGKDSLRWSVAVDSADSGMEVHFDSLKRKLLVTAPTGELLRDRIIMLSVTVTDPSGISSTLHGNTFIIIEKNDGPVITLRGQSKLFNTPFDTLVIDSCGYDPEHNSRLYWNIERGDYFYPDSLYTVNCPGEKGIPSCFRMLNGKVRIAPDTVVINAVPATQSTIADTLRFTVQSVTGTDTATVTAKIPYVWNRIQIIPIDTGLIIIPPFQMK